MLPPDYAAALPELATSTGAAFLQTLAETLRTHTGVDLVTVGELRIAEQDRVRVLVASGIARAEDIGEYALDTAPCHQVLARGRRVIVADDLQTNLPTGGAVKAMGARSYFGLPLQGADGRPAGLLAALGLGPLDPSKVERVLDDLQPALDRASEELQALQARRALEALSSCYRITPGRPPFEQLILHVVSTMRVRYGMVAECIDGDPDHYRVLAAAMGGKERPELVDRILPYSGSPCQALRHGDQSVVPTGLQDAFQDIEFYSAHDLDAYFGAVLRDLEGRVIGHVVFLHDHPLAPEIGRDGLLGSMLERIAVELQRHRAERERERTEEALLVRRKTESLGLLVGTIAHDFNNLLAGMLGHTELALDELDPASEAFTDVEAARGGMLRARDLIGQLLDYARGDPSRDTAPRDINELVRETVELTPFERKSNKHIELDLAPDLPAVLGHPAQIRQLIINLLLNAFDAFDGQPGRVTVSTALAPVDGALMRRMCTQVEGLPEQCVRLEVRDEGAGMSPETAMRAFDPYFTTKPDGRGLGMAAVQGIVHRHGGGLTLDSEPGRGTTVQVYLPPLAEPAVTDPETKPKRKTMTLENRSVLVVDDERIVRRVVADQLDRLGLTPLEAANGHDALAQLETHPEIWAAIIDITMPGMTGWQTLEHLRARKPNLQAIMMSGYVIAPPEGSPEVRLLDKPFTWEVLREALVALEPPPD